jgi:hypothetical protein
MRILTIAALSSVRSYGVADRRAAKACPTGAAKTPESLEFDL